MRRIATRRPIFIALVVVTLGALVVASPSANARVFTGHVMYAFHDLATGNGYVYVFKNNGLICGIARFSGIGTNQANTFAFQVYVDMISRTPPYNFFGSQTYSYYVPQPAIAGHWTTMYVSPGDNTVSCSTSTTEFYDVDQYYIRY